MHSTRVVLIGLGMRVKNRSGDLLDRPARARTKELTRSPLGPAAQARIWTNIMPIGRFLGGVAALIMSPDLDRYLLLKRSATKDFGAGVWECVTGRVDQGEGFEEALHREVREELGVAAQLAFILGTTHFYRGDARPENELIGIVFCCTIADPAAIQLSAEHSEHRWVTAAEAEPLLTDAGPNGIWILEVIRRAESVKPLVPAALRERIQQLGIELG
jgi:8-oxo-dGTP pyrophosphatase MutT (NUDIX family)